MSDQSNTTNPGIIALVPDQWESIWMSRHYLLSGLSEQMKVLWVSPPDYVESWRNNGWIPERRKSGVQKVSERLWAYSPRLPADYKRHYTKQGIVPSLFRRYNAWWQRRYVEKIENLARLMGMEQVILYLWRPEFSALVKHIPHDLLCYHIDDEYSFDPSADAPTSNEEEWILRQSDLVFIHSRTLLEKKGLINPNTHYVPNGVDFEAFRRAMASSEAEPKDLRAIPHPRIGYVGYIKRHIDLDLLRDLACRRRDWSLVLAGPIRDEHHDIADAITALKREPNVHFLGTKAKSDVPHYVKGLDVCLLPYRRTYYTKYIYPLKLHEYLACGKPVVATPLENLREFGDVLRFAQSAPEWVDRVGDAINDSGACSMEERVAVASRHDWSFRVEVIAQLLE